MMLSSITATSAISVAGCIFLCSILAGMIISLRKSYRVRTELRNFSLEVRNELRHLVPAVGAVSEMLAMERSAAAASGNNPAEQPHSAETPPATFADASAAIYARLLETDKRIEDLTNRLAQAEGQCSNWQYESQKMSYLATNHPERQHLRQTLRPLLMLIDEQLDRVLFPMQIPVDNLDWMHKLRDRRFPYSLTDEEGFVLYKLIVDHDLKEGYEIATAFGISSFYQGLALKQTGGRLLSVDAYIEEADEDFLYDAEKAREHAALLQQRLASEETAAYPQGLKFAIDGAKRLGIDQVVDYRVAFSPAGIEPLLQGWTLDYAFIDGGHFGEQPIRDLEAILPFLNRQRFMLVFHDTQCDAVAGAVHHAVRQTGGMMFSIHTRNRLVLVCKGLDESKLQSCREIVVRQCA